MLFYDEVYEGDRVAMDMDAPSWANSEDGTDLGFRIYPGNEGVVIKRIDDRKLVTVLFDKYPGQNVLCAPVFLAMLKKATIASKECTCPIAGPTGLMARGCTCGHVKPYQVPQRIV